MAMDKTNMGPQSITVKPQRKGKVSMALPRTDDGMVHKAVGEMSNTTAAHYANAMDQVVGGPSAEATKQSSGR